MDIAKFTEKKTGELVKISIPNGHDWAFVPQSLPPNWKISPEISPILTDANGLLRELNGIGRQMQNPMLLLQPLQSREALRSSSLEGTYTTPFELLLFEREPREETPHEDAKVRETREVANYASSLKYGWTRIIVDKVKISSLLIREMHQVLLTGVRGRDKTPGKLREEQVFLGSTRRYIPPPDIHLPAAMDNLDAFIENAPGCLHPLVAAFILHYQFEAIHPFCDGNGRIGRVLLSLTVAKWCDLKLPWLYLSPFFERFKDEYIDNMFRVSTHGDWNRWIEFCLRGTHIQADDAITRCELLHELKRRFQEIAKDQKSNRLYEIIDHLFESPVFEISDIRKWCSVSWPTAASDADQLMELGIAQHLQGTRPKRFWVPKVFDIAYEEDISTIDRDKFLP